MSRQLNRSLAAWSAALVSGVLVAGFLTVGPVETLTAGGAAAAPAATSPPSTTPEFARAPSNLASLTAGGVIRTRTVTLGFERRKLPYTATQIAYRTTDQQLAPAVAVTTVIRPIVAGPTRIVSYHMAYDGLGPVCDPSHTLLGNNPSTVTTSEQTAIAAYVAAGYTVVVSDYEGPQWEWTIGRQSAYAALDGVRAAEKVLRVPTSTPVGLVGYSGGSIPTEVGAEVAPRYAPELRIVGAAAGGLPVEIAHNLPYISGSRQWAGVIPAVVVAYQRAYGLDTTAFLSPRGAQITRAVSAECINTFAGAFPGLTNAQMVKARYGSLLGVPAARAALNDNIMGTAGTPRVPMLLGIGHSDSIGDSIMITGDVRTLARQHCASGIAVDYREYRGRDHSDAGAPFEIDALGFLGARFAGARPVSSCGSIPPGNPLRPIS